MKELDRHLIRQAGRKVYTYRRNVPKDMLDLDARAPRIVKSTGTKSILEAREIRDAWEQADDSFWDALRAGMDANTAREAYDAAVTLRQVRGTTKLPSFDMMELKDDPAAVEKFTSAMQGAMSTVSNLPVHNLPPDNATEAEVAAWREKYKQSRAAGETLTDRQMQAAVTLFKAETGMVKSPPLSAAEAFDFYIEDLARDEWENKSKEQHRIWLNVMRRAMNCWVDIVGNGAVFLETDREQALLFHKVLSERLKAGEIKPNTANRYTGILRKVWQSVCDHYGQDTANPFRNMSWKDRKPVKRPANTSDWVITTLLMQPSLAEMNAEERRIYLMMIETGMRPSEICNLQPENIHLDANIPFVHVTEMDGVDIKTQSSDREIPLVGVSLEAMRHHPDGFPRYFDNYNSCTTAINKFMRENNLREKPDRTLYSVRHLFKDRLRAACSDSEMRDAIMGHKNDRPDYGEGFTLEAKQEVLASMALPFDASIV